MASLSIFKKAKKIIDSNGVSLQYIKGEKIVFSVVGKNETHTVTLTFVPVGNGKKVYQKVWSCTCKASSVRGMLYNAECSHTIACLVWLVNNLNEVLVENGKNN